MRKLLYIIPLLFGMALSSCYDKEIDRINDRLDDMSDTMIASVSQQIASINNSILLLNNTNKELGEYIAALEAEAENLQTQITATNTKIDEVKTEVLSTISSENANILAELEALRNTTTARLEEINATIAELQAADGDMSAQIAALEAEAAQLEAQLAETNTKIDTVKSELTETISTEKANILAELEAFKATVNGELDAIKAVLETLKAKDVELDGKIATLQEYVDTELKATEDWATATFATLEQYNEVVSTIATIEGTIEGINESIASLETRINEKIAKDIETACATLSVDLQNAVKEVTDAYTSAITTAKNELTEAYTSALEGAISALETSMKEWVNEQLAGYYTIAEMDAKLQVMQTALESKITASEDYLKGLISDLEGEINEKVAENSKLIATLSASLSALESTLADRAQDIIANTQAIEENAKSIKENAEKILANGENIQANATLIAENKTLIAQNEQLIKSNQSAIAALQSGVSANSQTIATNATNIATNASDIATNAAHIANNASAIADNLAAIATNATNIAKLQSELEATANDITEAYTNAIATAIATNNGVIEEKIATEIQKVNDKIDALTQRVATLEQTVSNISTRLENVENDIIDIQEQLTSLVNRIQSISYIPQYFDGKATIDTDKKIGVFDFHISPKSALSDLARVWHSALSVKAVHTQTRSTALIELPITYFKANTTEGTFSIQIDATNLGDDFFAGNREASVALHLSDGDNEYISSYINLALGVVEGIENAPANNEIWYTSSVKEDINEDCFDSVILSHTFENGVGVITFCDEITKVGNDAEDNYESAFKWNTGLENSCITSITLPNSITSIERYAFAHCEALKQIVLPSNLKHIGICAFYGCSALEYITIPNRVTTIDGSAFAECDALTRVIIPDNVESIGVAAFSRCDNLELFEGKFAADNGRCLIVNGQLVSVITGLTEYVILDGVTSLGPCVFDNRGKTSYLYAGDSYVQLTHVVIPNTVTEIGPCAFRYCLGLASITIPESVTEIGNQVFEGCLNLSHVKCLSTTPPTIGSNVFRKGLTICVPEESLQEYLTQWSDYAFYITTEKDLDPSNLDYLFYEGFDGNGVAQNNNGWDTDMSSEKGQCFCSPLPEYQTAVTYSGNNTTVRSNSVSDSRYSNYDGSGSNNVFFLTQSTLEVRGISLSELMGCALTLSFGGQKYHPDSNAFSFDEFKVYISEDNTKWSEVEYFFSEGTDLNNGRWNLATANFLLKEVPQTISIRFDSSANGYRIDDIKLAIGEGGTEIDLSQGLILSNAEIEDDTIIDDTVIEIPENAEVWLLNKIDQTWVEDTHSTYGVGEAITIGNVKFGFYENTNPNDRSTALQNDHIRVFKDSAISISTIDGSKIKTVVFECLSNDKCVNLAVTDGSVAVANTENLTISWTSTDGVDVFNAVASMGQVRLTKMYIAIDENTSE